jgi:hypothetical protein
MSFWSKLGKGLLKVAPIAASFIPGVGPIMSAVRGGISAASAAADKKLSGGSWTDAAMSGAGAYQNNRGIGPSGKGGQSSGGGWQDKLGGILGGGNDPYQYRTPPFAGNNYGPSDQQGSSNRFGGGDTDYIRDAVSGVNKSGQQGGGLSGFLSKLGGVKGIAGIASGVGGALAAKKLLQNRGGEEVPKDESYGPGPEPRDMGTSRFQRRMQRELGPVMGQANQNNPNFALSIGQGRMDAMRDQPFRGGYDVRTTTGYDDNDQPEYEYTPMPKIGPGRRRRQDQYYGGGGRPAEEQY